MREIPCQQGSEEWLMLRAGLPTASAFENIVTPLGKLSKTSRKYKAFLLAERIMKRPIVEHVSEWMDRGTQFEESAVAFLEVLTGQDTQRCGFVVNDAGTIGASPDRWCSADGQVEIKVPKPENHFAYYLAQRNIDRYGAELEALLEQPKLNTPVLADKGIQERYEEAVKNSLYAEYKVQTQGQLWITGREWSHLLSYSPESLPEVHVHVKPDKPFIEILAQNVSEFSRDLEESAADLVKRGIIQQ